MKENDKERRKLIREYCHKYMQLQKNHNLRQYSHFDMYGNNLIEIWEYEGGRKGRCICKVKEESEIACYQRAIEMLESYSGKEIVRHEKRAG